jgi:hypothetical protein
MDSPLKCPCCGNINTSSAVTDDVIPLKRKGLKKLAKFLVKCTDDVDGVRECDIMLRSLEHYLAEEKNPDSGKALLLLRYWLDVSPKLLEGVSDHLNAASELMKVILAASR